MQEMKKTRVQPLGRGDHQEEEMATDSSILAWRIPGTEEPGGLQSTGPQRVGHDLGTKQQQLHGDFGLHGDSVLLTLVLLSVQLCFVIKEK